MSTFTDLLRLIANGDPVDEATINRIFRTQNANLQHLKTLLEQSLSGSAIYRRDATVKSDVSEGQPVFYNVDTQQFEKGLAQAFVQSGVLLTSSLSQLWGICSHKHNSTKADILMQGYASDVDLSNAISGTIEPGLYYLSGTTAGKLTQQEPSVSIPVLFVDADEGVYVKPSFADIYTSHKHYRFELNCIPAGTAELAAGQWSVAADDSVIGWLPADDPSFDGNAPAGAKFGYNLSASPLANAWPPLPLDGASLEWINEAESTILPIQSGHAVIDAHGIWWMTDCEDEVPWPVSATTTTTTSTTTPEPDCPFTSSMSLVLWYSRPKFQTSKSVVTSLRTAENSLLTIRCVTPGNEEDDTTGDLEITLDLELALAELQTTTGHIVLKGLDDDGKLTRGPVIEKLKAGGSNVLLTSSGGADDDGYHVGSPTISVVQQVLGAELDVQAIQLQGAESSVYKDTMTIKLAQDRETAYRGEIYVPYDIGVSTVTLGLRFWLLGRVAGTLPELTLTARVYPRPTPTAVTPTSLVTSDSAVTLTNEIEVGIDQYIEVTSANISVPAGSVVQFTLTRDDSSPGDGYNGDVHVLRQVGVITGAS